MFFLVILEYFKHAERTRPSQEIFKCSKSAIETLEKVLKYVQS